MHWIFLKHVLGGVNDRGHRLINYLYTSGVNLGPLGLDLLQRCITTLHTFYVFLNLPINLEDLDQTLLQIYIDGLGAEGVQDCIELMYGGKVVLDEDNIR